MTNDWEVNLISEPFELKQNEYDCNSTFIIFLSKAGVDYDRDDFGDLILDYEEWGTIDPPGPNKGFGSKIDPDFLEELWDDECRSKLTIKKLKDTGDIKELSEEIFPYIDGIFTVNESKNTFDEMPHEVKSLSDFEERKMFLDDLGLDEPGVSKLIKKAYSLLNLQTYFTAGEKEVKAWTIKKGMTAPEAAGVIHTDFQKGFIKAEVIKYNDFIELGSENAVKEAGKLMVQGKEYVLKDGDIMHFRFNV